MLEALLYHESSWHLTPVGNEKNLQVQDYAWSGQACTAQYTTNSGKPRGDGGTSAHTDKGNDGIVTGGDEVSAYPWRVQQQNTV